MLIVGLGGPRTLGINGVKLRFKEGQLQRSAGSRS